MEPLYFYVIFTNGSPKLSNSILDILDLVRAFQTFRLLMFEIIIRALLLVPNGVSLRVARIDPSPRAASIYEQIVFGPSKRGPQKIHFILVNRDKFYSVQDVTL